VEEKAEIGIIGGTGVYNPDILEDAKQIKLYTPFGPTSDLITIGFLKCRKIAFIPRHGSAHTIPPHKVNNRANIWAMKEIGATRIISTCATGSLQENYKPGDIVIVDQFVDWGKSVETFYEGGKFYHVSLADPFCPELRKILIDAAKELNIPVHEKGTYLRISGPQFSTRSASKMYRSFADLIGMTGVPESILSRELELCHAIICTITDYDVYKEKPVSMEEVKNTMAKNMENLKKLIETAIPKIPKERMCACKDSLKGAEA